MFRITRDPSSGRSIQCLVRNYRNGSIVSVDMDVVGVMAAYLPVVCVCVLHSLERHCVCTAQSREALCVYCTVQTVQYTHTHTHTHHGQICCHNTDYVHINGRDRTITVILAKHCIELPDDGSLVIRNTLKQF